MAFAAGTHSEFSAQAHRWADNKTCALLTVFPLVNSRSFQVEVAFTKLS